MSDCVESDSGVYFGSRAHRVQYGGMTMCKVLRDVILLGAPISLLGLLGTAALLTVLELPLQWYPAAGALPLLCGCFFAGLSAGRRLRHSGWRCGAEAAFLLTVLWYAADCALCGGLRSPMLLTAALPAGMFGGICGVNTKLPAPHRRMHRAMHLRERMVLVPKVRKARIRARKNGAEQSLTTPD